MPGTDNINIELIKPLLKEFPLSDKYASAFSYISIEEYPIHSHMHMELIYVAKGSLKVKVGISDYILNSGEFTIIDPFELHALYSTGEPNSTYILELNTDFYDPCEEEIIFVSSYSLYRDAAGKDFSKIIETIKRIFELHMTTALKHGDDVLIFPMGVNDSDADYEKILLRSLINYFELYFTSEYFLLSDHKENTLRDNVLQANRLKSILSYFYQNFPKKIHLQDVADLTFVNRYHISHLVKSGIGLTFSELLQHIRIEKAEIYLLATDMPINQIVFELGFSSYRYFNQHFKNLFHMTPNSHRKKYRYSTIRYKDISYMSPTKIQDISAMLKSSCLFSNTAEYYQKTETKPCLIQLKRLFDDMHNPQKLSEAPKYTESSDYVFPANSPLYDSPYFPSILLSFMGQNIEMFIKKHPLFFNDDISTISNCNFTGQPGHTTHTGIRKSTFYLQRFLKNFLGEDTVHIPGFIASKKTNGLHILFYNAPENIISLLPYGLNKPHILNKTEKELHSAEKEYIIDLEDMNTDSFTVIEKAKLNIQLDSFVQWQRMGCPDTISENIIQILNETSSPDTHFEKISDAYTNNIYNVSTAPFEVLYMSLFDFTMIT